MVERARLDYGFGSQGVELLGGGAAVCPFLPCQLAFPQQVHELNPSYGTLGGVERLEPQHGTGEPLHAAMILFHDIMEILHLTDDDRGAVFRIIAPDGGRLGLAPINRHLLRPPMAADGLDQEAHGGSLVPLLRQEEIEGLTGLVHRPIELTPLAFDFGDSSGGTPGTTARRSE
jgi:hypothetical protein